MRHFKEKPFPRASFSPRHRSAGLTGTIHGPRPLDALYAYRLAFLPNHQAFASGNGAPRKLFLKRWRSRVPLLLLTALTGCIRSDKVAVRPSSDPIRFQVSSEPVSLDPSLIEDGNGLRLIANLMDGLVGYDGGGQLRFRLAESVKTSDDGLRYEFALRPGLTWSDGVPIEAAQFVVALRRALNPTTGSKLAEMLYPIRGARAVAHREIPPTQLGVSAPAPQLLVIELEHALPTFLEVLTLPQAMPLREDILNSHGGKWPLTAPVTGAYQVAAARFEQMLLLEPNRAHWEKTSAHPVVLTIVQDETTAARLFEKGKLDILTRIPALEYDRLRKRGQILSFPMVATYFLAFNVRMAPFTDVQWRRRFSGAIDREGLVRVLGSGEPAAWHWIPRGLEGATDPVRPQKLTEALAHAHAKMGAALPPVGLAFDSGGRNSLVVEKVQHDVRRTLGLRIRLESADWKMHVRRMKEDPLPIYRFGWLAPFLDPISHLRAFTSDNPNNYTGWKNTDYDQLVEKIARLPHGPEREALVRKADRLLTEEEAVVVPLFHYVQDYAVSARVKGMRAAPNSVVRFSELAL